MTESLKNEQTSSRPFTPASTAEAVQAYRLGAELVRELLEQEPEPEPEQGDSKT
jgi:hypothetical protein